MKLERTPMLRNKRNGGSHGFEDASNLDVVISREIDTSVSRELKKSLDLIENTTSGVINPLKIGHMSLRILGSESLKDSLGVRKGRQYYIDQDKLNDIECYINDGSVDDVMALRIYDKDDPFYIDKENDQLITELKDSNREYTNSRLFIASKIQQFLGLRNLSHSEINELTQQSNPELSLAGISRNMVEGSQLQDFLDDPNYFIRDAIRTNLDKTYKKNSKELIPEKIVFGGFRVALRQRRPNHFVINDQADSLGKHEFNEDGKLIFLNQEKEYV